MAWFIASVALLGLLAATRAPDRRFATLAAVAAGAPSRRSA
jgi:hypothetical protein